MLNILGTIQILSMYVTLNWVVPKVGTTFLTFIKNNFPDIYPGSRFCYLLCFELFIFHLSNDFYENLSIIFYYQVKILKVQNQLKVLTYELV